MSYREENGQVVLTMSREDYDKLMLILGAFKVYTYEPLGNINALMNRLNQGNPNYTPYEVAEKS